MNKIKKKRYYGTYSLKEKVLSSFNNEINKRNFFNIKIITHWRNIVGDEFFDKLTPCNIVMKKVIDNKNILAKILYCQTKDRQFANEFLFYKNDILQKINFYFGEEKSVFVDIKLKLI